MPDRSRRRAGMARIAARERSRYLAKRLGVVLRESRIALRQTQSQASHRAGVSQQYWSCLERGLGSAASLETIAACAAAVDTELAAFLQARPGADLPRDIVHLRGQAAIVREAEPGGWRASIEVPIDPDSHRSRSIDVALERMPRGEIAVVELVDLIADAGADLRGLSDKVAAIRRSHPRHRVAGMLAVRATQRNRALLAELGPLVDARFPAPSAAWLKALHDPGTPMPSQDGLIWARVDGSGLLARRR
ncbi:MAG TPA: helix-turn-helix transcriptional regulator [Candidatus Limnocylindrales bacterium]|nr:helix-turn-helix transcriptional regulator [Candidatus Limnocylindrales bacterium]